MAERKKRKKKDSDKYRSDGGRDTSDYMQSGNNMMDAFRQQAYSEYEAAYARAQNKRVNVVDTVYQLKAQGTQNINNSRIQASSDLFMQGANMKDMASHVASSAKSRIAKRELAAKVSSTISGSESGAVASKIASKTKSSAIIEEEQPADNATIKKMKIQKNFETRKKEFGTLNEVITQTKNATGSIPHGMLQAALTSLLSFYNQCASLPPGDPRRDSMCDSMMEQMERGDLDEDMIHSLLGGGGGMLSEVIIS